MVQKLKKFIKNNSIFSLIYYYLGSFLVNLLKLFVKTDDKLILFVSFGGRQFSDSPKAIYDYILSDERFKDYKLIWAFTDPDKYSMKNESKVKIDTIKYFILALKARVWITNSGIERLLNFKGKNTFYVNTWHGVPIKMIGKDHIQCDIITKKWYKNTSPDVMVAESDYDLEIISKVFSLEKEKILKIGLPRNDELREIDKLNIVNLKRKLNIPLNKKVILYAPTFREYMIDSSFNNIITIPIDFKKWKKKLGEEYVVLVRTHYFVNKILGLDFNNSDFLIDVSNYENINELMIISDILISDYSSVFFDFSLLEKPMLCYPYDYEEYSQKRGLYLDLSKIFPNQIIKEEDKLLDTLLNLNYSEECNNTRKFKMKYMCGSGKATKDLVDFIFDHL